MTHLAGDAIVMKKQSCTANLVPRRADVLQLAIGSWLNVSRARRMGPRKCRSSRHIWNLVGAFQRHSRGGKADDTVPWSENCFMKGEDQPPNGAAKRDWLRAQSTWRQADRGGALKSSKEGAP